MHYRRFSTLACALTLLVTAQSAQAGVLLQGFYWDVPSPAAGTATAPFWWDRLATNATSLRQAGFTAIWIPPVWKGASGGYSAGYDPFDDYDLGSKNQMSTVTTRYGTREQLQRSVAMLRANGMDVYLDMVLNHRSGDPGNYSFLYADAYGNPTGGRYQKGQYDFVPNVSQDPGVWDNPEISFGRNLAVYNGGGVGNTGAYNYTNLMQAGDWLTKALDVQGFRFDYAKGVSTNFLVGYLNYGAMANKFAVSEFWDGDRNNLATWVAQTQNKTSVFDFPLRDQLKSMCDGGGFYNMRNLDGAGYKGINPLGAVTFVDNHDTDQSGAIINNKLLAYAHILTAEGYPCVFYKDWSTEPGCYGLQTGINNLIWIHEKIAAGGTTQRWKDDDVFAYERTGGSRLLVGLNDNGASSRTVTVDTGFGANVALHDYTGHSPDITTNGLGQATITIPADVNGGGYVCYSRTGITGAVGGTQKAVTQEFAGAQDLDIKPADNTQEIQVARVYVQAGKTIQAQLYWDGASWTANTSIQLRLLNTTNAQLATKTYASTTAQGSGFTATATVTGWYTFKIRSFNTPAANLKPAYWLKATYTAPQQ